MSLPHLEVVARSAWPFSDAASKVLHCSKMQNGGMVEQACHCRSWVIYQQQCDKKMHRLDAAACGSSFMCQHQRFLGGSSCALPDERKGINQTLHLLQKGTMAFLFEIKGQYKQLSQCTQSIKQSRCEA